MELLKDHIGEAVILLVGGIVTFLQNMKSKRDLKDLDKQLELKDAELAKLKLDNGDQIMEQYRKALDDLENRYEKRHQHLEEDYKRRLEDIKEDYERRIASIKEQNEDRYRTMQRMIDGMKRQIDNWKEKYNMLKAEFDSYRKKHA